MISKRWFVVTIHFLGSFGYSTAFPYSFTNTTEYYKMPPLYKFDDFEECYGKYENSLYCVVNTQIKADNSSDLYRYVMEYSSKTKQRYRHDKLQRGICMETCKNAIDKFDVSVSEQFYIEEFEMDTYLTFDFIRYYKLNEYRSKFNKIVNICVNLELMNRYNLSGFSTIEYCFEKDSKIPIDLLDIIFIVVNLIIFCMVIFSSLYDRHLRNNSSFALRNNLFNNNDNHYKTVPKNMKHRLLLFFSVRRNWSFISSKTKFEHRELRFLGALRTLTLFGVIIGHIGWYAVFFPSSNPIFIEDIYSKLEAMLMVNGFLIVQTFFGISGFLNSLMTLSHIEKLTRKINGISFLIQSVVLRFFRLIPLLAFAVVLHATWLYRIGSGPFWQKVSEPDRQFCRDHWWKDLFLLNNYLDNDEKCLIHAWYLAADFQLSILGTIVILIVLKYPKLKCVIFGAIFSFSMFICGFVTYSNNLEPIVIFSPETLRNQLFKVNENDKSYFELYYTPTHTNLSTYFLGLFCGIYYYNFKKSHKNHKKSPFSRVIWYILVLLGFGIIFTGYIFYTNDFEASVLLAIISTLMKHLYSVCIIVVIIGIIFRYGWFIPNIMNYPMFRILGRISYGAFIIHLFIIKLVMANHHRPLDLNVISLLSYSIAIFTVSSLIGIILTLFIDIPTSSVLKMIFMKSSEGSSFSNNIENNFKDNENGLSHNITKINRANTVEPCQV